jgi:hypothetical protein
MKGESMGMKILIETEDSDVTRGTVALGTNGPVGFIFFGKLEVRPYDPHHAM